MISPSDDAGAIDAPADGQASKQVTQDDDALLPVRMLNEFAYCPRLYHLMHVEGRWADNHYTVDGKYVHRRVDKLDHVLPAPGSKPFGNERGTDDVKGQDIDAGDESPEVVRSVPLGSDALGITAKLDLVSCAPGPDGIDEAVPVETKRGRVPNNPERSWEPERVQLMAQGLLLREHGYRCDHGVLYFAASRTRVDVSFTQGLEERTLLLIERAREQGRSREMPEPLEDSPKCNGCSLNGVCLPDETRALKAVRSGAAGAEPEVVGSAEAASEGGGIRRMYPPRETATPLYVQEQGAYVGKSNKRLVIKKTGKVLSEVRLKEVSQLVLCGNVQVSTQTLQLLCEENVPVVFLSMGHWFYGIAHGLGLKNAFDRAAQFKAAEDPVKSLDFALRLVRDKVMNQRTLIRRNAAKGRALDESLRDIDDLLPRIDVCRSQESLLGLEGNAAAAYFKCFGSMLKPRGFNAEWDFKNRNRRPPKDPINAMLSFGYALLTKECTVALIAEGLDPYWGLYHKPRHGRPALALDLMEPFRSTVVDSAVITAVNTGMVQGRNFTVSPAGCMLQPAGRKGLIQAYESRLDQLVTHPLFDYRCSWRSVIRVQARLLSRYLRGDVPVFENVVTR